MYDLAVIGGGPAGTSAAITASRAGARVALLERGRFPRHKVCGEFVSAESLELLRQLLDPEPALLLNAIRISEARIYLDGRILRTSIVPAAASVARFDLDQALWNAAVQAGAVAHEQTTVETIEGQGPFLVRTAAGEVETKAIINATGRWSNLNSTPAPNGKNSVKWLGLKGHFAEISPADTVDLYFFDGGYCGISRVEMANDDAGSRRVNACAMVRADVASTLPEVFSLHPALMERSRGWEPLTEPVSTFPLFFRTPQPANGNIVYAGDTAGFVDPFVGDGISLALRSGALAAETLMTFIRGDCSLEAAVAKYCASYTRKLAPVFRNASRVRQALRLPRALRAPALFVLQNVPSLTRQLVHMTR